MDQVDTNEKEQDDDDDDDEHSTRHVHLEPLSMRYMCYAIQSALHIGLVHDDARHVELCTEAVHCFQHIIEQAETEWKVRMVRRIGWARVGVSCDAIVNIISIVHIIPLVFVLVASSLASFPPLLPPDSSARSIG